MPIDRIPNAPMPGQLPPGFFHELASDGGVWVYNKSNPKDRMGFQTLEAAVAHLNPKVTTPVNPVSTSDTTKFVNSTGQPASTPVVLSNPPLVALKPVGQAQADYKAAEANLKQFDKNIVDNAVGKKEFDAPADSESAQKLKDAQFLMNKWVNPAGRDPFIQGNSFVGNEIEYQSYQVDFKNLQKAAQDYEASRSKNYDQYLQAQKDYSMKASDYEAAAKIAVNRVDSLQDALHLRNLGIISNDAYSGFKSSYDRSVLSTNIANQNLNKQIDIALHKAVSSGGMNFNQAMAIKEMPLSDKLSAVNSYVDSSARTNKINFDQALTNLASTGVITPRQKDAFSSMPAEMGLKSVNTAIADFQKNQLISGVAGLQKDGSMSYLEGNRLLNSQVPVALNTLSNAITNANFNKIASNNDAIMKAGSVLSLNVSKGMSEGWIPLSVGQNILNQPVNKGIQSFNEHADLVARNTDTAISLFNVNPGQAQLDMINFTMKGSIFPDIAGKMQEVSNELKASPFQNTKPDAILKGSFVSPMEFKGLKLDNLSSYLSNVASGKDAPVKYDISSEIVIKNGKPELIYTVGYLDNYGIQRYHNNSVQLGATSGLLPGSSQDQIDNFIINNFKASTAYGSIGKDDEITLDGKIIQQSDLSKEPTLSVPFKSGFGADLISPYDYANKLAFDVYSANKDTKLHWESYQSGAHMPQDFYNAITAKQYDKEGNYIPASQAINAINKSFYAPVISQKEAKEAYDTLQSMKDASGNVYFTDAKLAESLQLAALQYRLPAGNVETMKSWESGGYPKLPSVYVTSQVNSVPGKYMPTGISQSLTATYSPLETGTTQNADNLAGKWIATLTPAGQYLAQANSDIKNFFSNTMDFFGISNINFTGVKQLLTGVSIPAYGDLELPKVANLPKSRIVQAYEYDQLMQHYGATEALLQNPVWMSAATGLAFGGALGVASKIVPGMASWAAGTSAGQALKLPALMDARIFGMDLGTAAIATAFMAPIVIDAADDLAKGEFKDLGESAMSLALTLPFMAVGQKVGEKVGIASVNAYKGSVNAYRDFDAFLNQKVPDFTNVKIDFFNTIKDISIVSKQRTLVKDNTLLDSLSKLKVASESKFSDSSFKSYYDPLKETQFTKELYKEGVPTKEQFSELYKNQITTGIAVESITGKSYKDVRGIELFNALEQIKNPRTKEVKSVLGSSVKWETQFEASLKSKPLNDIQKATMLPFGSLRGIDLKAAMDLEKQKSDDNLSSDFKSNFMLIQDNLVDVSSSSSSVYSSSLNKINSVVKDNTIFENKILSDWNLIKKPFVESNINQIQKPTYLNAQSSDYSSIASSKSLLLLPVFNETPQFISTSQDKKQELKLLPVPKTSLNTKFDLSLNANPIVGTSQKPANIQSNVPFSVTDSLPAIFSYSDLSVKTDSIPASISTTKIDYTDQFKPEYKPEHKLEYKSEYKPKTPKTPDPFKFTEPSKEKLKWKKSPSKSLSLLPELKKKKKKVVKNTLLSRFWFPADFGNINKEEFATGKRAVQMSSPEDTTSAFSRQIQGFGSIPTLSQFLKSKKKRRSK